MKTLNGVSIIVTGATAGIGQSTAKLLAKHGAKLALCGRNAEKLAEIKKEIGGDVYTKAFCVSSEADIISFVAEAERSMGPIAALVNNAGVNSKKALVTEIATEDLDWMMTVNFRASAIFMREVGRLMQARKNGRVVNILSSSALFTTETVGAYTASKFAIDGLTKVFRKEMREHGVGVTAIYPGGVDTGFRAVRKPEYISPDVVAESVLGVLRIDERAVVDELVVRPFVEKNYI